MSAEEKPPAEQPSSDPGFAHHEPPPNRSGTALGFLVGVAFSILLAAYPLYIAYESKQNKQELMGQNILDTLQMRIAVVHTELESIDRQLAMIAEAEKRYSALVEQKFDLETSRTHLLTRLDKLESALDKAEKETGLSANQFDKITQSMRLD